MNEIRLRPARPDDEAAVRALSAHIWDGEDYVPDQFLHWVADEKGPFTVAVAGKTLAGFGKLTALAPDEWWMEGLRVHPDFRGLGIARKLHEHVVDLADEIGSGTLRFATSSKNEAVQRLAARTAFHQVAIFRFATLAAGDSPESVGYFEPAMASDLPSLRRRIENSEALSAAGGLFEEHWKWLALRPRLPDLVDQERVFWWHDPGSGQAGILVVWEGDDCLRINFIDAPNPALPTLCQALPSFAKAQGWSLIKSRLVAVEPILAAMTAAGAEIDPDFAMLIFERQIGKQGE